MRIPTYISPSQATLFYKDREEYYLRYLCEHRPDRFAQTPAMAVGGSFDSHVTRALALRYFGREDPRCATEYDLSVMLDSAIEPHLDRPALTTAGLELFKRYMATGGYGRLCAELDSGTDIHMQGKLYYNVPNTGGLTLMGLPDVAFVRGGVQHVYDFKVNGFFSAASPLKGHVWKGTGSSESVHKEAILGKLDCGTIVDLSGYFDTGYLRQTSTYAWALQGGCESPIVVGIEQTACRVASTRWKDPIVLRGAEHVAVTNVSTRSLIPVETQKAVMQEYIDMWDVINSGWIFDDVDREVSDETCARLDLLAKGLVVDKDEDFNMLCGR